LLSSKTFHSLVIEGAPGWGKSSAVEEILKDKSQDFLTLGSYTTPLRLYRFLSEHPTEVLVIDDCAGIFGDSIAMSLLKAATWPSSGTDGTRLVSWGSTSDRVANQEFFFDGKIILLTNAVPSGGDGSAFTSRSLHYCITPSPDEMERIVRSVVGAGVFENVALASEVAELLIEHGKRANFKGVNLRTLNLGYELANSGNGEWKELFGRILPTPDPTSLALRLSTEQSSSVEEQFRSFHQMTGLSRRTFFYYRARNGL